MDPRYSGRLSPPRRYVVAPGRNSTGRLDTDYESYYQPRGSRESILGVGPRSSAERFRHGSEVHLVGSPSRTSRDNDYYVAPRYQESSHSSHRPPSIATSSGSSARYRPVISSAVDPPSSPYKSRSRNDEAYYIQPASSSGHSRHFSLGGTETTRYTSRDRDLERDRPVYRGSVAPPRHGEYLSPVLPIRDSRDRDYGYEYTDSREQAYRDTEPRSRIRRVSDVGSRDRPVSMANLDDYRRQGPPPTTRGLAKIEDEGRIRREYRYPRDAPSSRESSLTRGSREERDRPRPSRHLVAVHQDDGYSSNVEERARYKSHRHRHRESVDRDRYEDSDRRPEEPKKHHRHESEDLKPRHRRADSEERPQRSARHNDEYEDVRGSRDVRDEGYERDDGEKHRRRRHEDPRKDKNDDRKPAEGLALGGAGAAAAAGLAASAFKERRDRDSSDLESDALKERSRRHRHKGELEDERGSGSPESEESRRERRHRRRQEREEADRREQKVTDRPSRQEDDQDRRDRIVIVPDARAVNSKTQETYPEDSEQPKLRRKGRRRRDKGSSSDTESTDGQFRAENPEKSRVRVVSPARDGSAKPKSILRPPTTKFPEDPNPVREGVAPLKDPGQKDIPSDARWTKVDRKVINPAALELAKERYEEGPDYVIVLRVLTRDEIEKLAMITNELRRQRIEGEEAPRMIEDRHSKNGEESEGERPKQIAAEPYNDSHTEVPSQSRAREHVEAEDHDRPLLQKEASYQRLPPSSGIPTYPSIPGRSSISSPDAQPTSPPPIRHDSTYPSQGGGYRSGQA